MTHEVGAEVDTEVEERLMASMRDHVGGIKFDTEILARAGRRHRRRKTLRRSGFATLGVVAVVGAAVLAGGVFTGRLPLPGHGGPPDGGQNGGQNERLVGGAQARLVAAIIASEATSYRITVSVQGVKQPDLRRYSYTITGAYDPATDSGYLRMGQFEERLVDGVHYLGRGGTFVPGERGGFSGATFEWLGGQGLLGTSVDPGAMLDSLRGRDAKITETGPGAFHFEVTVRSESGKGKLNVENTGDVTVGADKRVARVVYASSVTGDSQALVDTVMEFSGYGEPVRVEKP